MKEIMNVAEKAAREAGALLNEHFGNIIDIEKKADQSLVTNIDKKAEQIITGIVRNAWPDHNIIGEESGISENNGKYTWVIDPIDGTHNFIRGIKLFGVSIGVLKKQEFIAGIIYLPVDNALYTAEKGSGAYKNDKKIFVSHLANINECTLLFDSGYKNDGDKKIEIFKKIAPSMFNVRMFGTSVRNLTYIAEGTADVLLEFDDHLWDFAAGITIVQEAGGLVTDFNGKSLTPQSRSYIASNESVHESVHKLLTET